MEIWRSPSGIGQRSYGDSLVVDDGPTMMENGRRGVDDDGEVGDGSAKSLKGFNDDAGGTGGQRRWQRVRSRRGSPTKAQRSVDKFEDSLNRLKKLQL